MRAFADYCSSNNLEPLDIRLNTIRDFWGKYDSVERGVKNMCYSGKCIFEISGGPDIGDCDSYAWQYRAAQRIADRYGIGICAIGQCSSSHSAVIEEAIGDFNKLFAKDIVHYL